MKKKLILMRHAKSDWSVSGQRDFDRGLNDRGFRDALKMGIRLFELGIQPDIVISSSSLRTRLTAEYVCERINFDIEKVDWRDSLYEVGLDEVLKQIVNISDQYHTVMMFGHNPTYTYLVEYLTGENIGEMPTAGAAQISFYQESWALIGKDSGKMDWFIYPKDTDD